MHDEQDQPSTPPRRPGLGSRWLLAFLDGAVAALADARRDEIETADEDDQCRLRSDHSRLTRGYREAG